MREVRGNGTRTRVTTDGPVPKNWQAFMRNSTNKTELYDVISNFITKSKCPIGKAVITTKESHVCCITNDIEVPYDEGSPFPLQPCTHEEFDTHCFLHCANASSDGSNQATIYCNDTDVVVLSLAFVTSLELEKLYLGFGQGKHFRYIPIHDLCKLFTANELSAFPAFPALTGSDTTSFLSGCGKQSAYKKWCSTLSLTPHLNALMTIEVETDLTTDLIAALESFVISLYSSTCPHTELNKARHYLFAKGARTFEVLPPSKAAFHEHLKRVVFQATFIWGASLSSNIMEPNKESWGWIERADKWQPHWTCLPSANKALPELVFCGCSVSCSGRCSCSKKNC